MLETARRSALNTCSCACHLAYLLLTDNGAVFAGIIQRNRQVNTELDAVNRAVVQPAVFGIVLT